MKLGLTSVLNVRLWSLKCTLQPHSTLANSKLASLETKSGRSPMLNVKPWNHDAKCLSLNVRLFKTHYKNHVAVSTNLYKF